MSEQYLKNVIEAALLAAGKPLSIEDFASLFEESGRPGKADIQAALAALESDYGGRGIEIKETAAGFRVQVRRELAEEISRLWPERPARYSRALLETLALIAYRQPITRGEIEAVRGVAVNPNIVKTLLERNWIRIVGQRDVPGRPELLGTTREFLDYFGLKSLEELPPLAELKAMADFNVQLELADVPSLAVAGSTATVEDSGAQATYEENGHADPPSEEAHPPSEEAEVQSEDSQGDDSQSEDSHGDDSQNASEDPPGSQGRIAASPGPR
ncbi:MAG TPA: SMC-Scp complex subunit ScpB [Steroidobacteraceae bacterium]|nr:SMC-Scp complex subunit ScpB [Steroidobacteraceae bacterium]